MVYRVVVLPASQSFEVNDCESVLQAALRQDVQLAHECTFGACGTCRLKIVEGSVDYEEFPMALTPQEAQQGYALACQARPRSDLVLSAEPALVPACEPQRATARVKALRWLTPEVANLQLELPDLPDFNYRPGQYMNVHLDDGTHRSFSMASQPKAGTLEFHVRRIPGGRFTDAHLARVAPGHALEVELPLGSFRYHREDGRPVLMVATGTGLAPIKSILESLMDDDDCPPVSLYWGMRSEADLYLDEEIGRWAQRLYEFRYVPVLSRATALWQGRRGHVQDAVLADLPDLSGYSIYLCGSPAMIADARRAFAAGGADLQRIYTDGFSFQHASAAAPAHAA